MIKKEYIVEDIQLVLNDMLDNNLAIDKLRKMLVSPFNLQNEESIDAKREFLSFILIILIVLNAFESFIDSPFKFGLSWNLLSKPSFMYPILINILLMAFYVTNRSKYYKLSIYGIIFTLILTNLLLSLFIKSSTELTSPIILVGFVSSIIVLVSALFLSIRNLIIITIFTLLSLLSIPLVVKIYSFNGFSMVFLFNVAIAVIIIIFSINNQKINQMLMDQSHAKSIFLARISHELKNPLETIYGYSNLLVENDPVIEDNKLILKKINHSAKFLIDLLDDFLDLNLIERGKLKIENEPVVIREVLQEIVDLYKKSLELKGLQLILNIEPQLPEIVYLDQKRLNQILINLLSNAQKYTDKGCVWVTATVKEINKLNQQIRLVLEVRDQGIGIPEDQYKYIFKSFERLGNRNKGIGLGLAITKKLVELFDGEISFISEVGKGTSFFVELPLKFKIN